MLCNKLKVVVSALVLSGAAMFAGSALAGDCRTYEICNIPCGVTVYNDNGSSVLTNYSFNAASRSVTFTASRCGMKKSLLLNNSVGFQALGTMTNRSRGVVMFNPYTCRAYFVWGPVVGDMFKAYDDNMYKWGRVVPLPVRVRHA